MRNCRMKFVSHVIAPKALFPLEQSRSDYNRRIRMDIAGLSTALSNISLQSRVSIAVLDRAMEAEEALGSGIVEMMDAAAMELSVNPGVGANFDIRI